MANTTNIIPNKLTMYQRVEGGVWHYRIKLKTGEWYRLSSRETDFEAAKEIANRTYYTADYKEKNRHIDVSVDKLRNAMNLVGL